MKSGIKKTLFYTGAAAAAGYLLYLLFKDDQDSEDEADLYQGDLGGAPRMSNKSATTMSRKECLDLLSKIVASQDKARELMNSLVESILASNFGESLWDLYSRVLPSVPLDPLEARGLTLFDLDFLVERYQNDPAVREYIVKIMNIPQVDPNTEPSEVQVTVQEVVAIHEYMLQQLQHYIQEFRAIPNHDELDKKVVTVTLQALISAKVQEQFKITHTALDRAIIHHHGELSMNQHFTRLTMHMQSEMAEVTGLYN
ncbi:hypothetical protein BdWA1_001711 [Babesia duncani]|uniref:Uncharacterized protein n=1 Tax=Babesia duncani TaxID=323732 RepID=A0AAD9PGR3_9APIC|nr:hypothetical protein BdWA1_004085 [Babesia duncani]KAK2194988.1 hypothetical protein BdWA1_003549 [Babesia duncani]KAK2196465.1 hypothetical protein BdWA1_001711 [Babesia duncani]